jgi:hypothetical protein
VSSDEQDSIDIPLADRPAAPGTTYTVSGAPDGIRVEGDRLVGTVSANAVSSTRTKGSLGVKDFMITITVEGTAEPESRTFTWQVVDSHLPMPDYVGAFGNGDAGLPDIGEVFTPRNQPAHVPGQFAKPSTIWHQSIVPGQPVRYGSPVGFHYWDPDACRENSSPPCNGAVQRGAG